MGIYLMTIATVDLYYSDVYILYDKSWRTSILCQFAGFLSTFSSELSVFTLTGKNPTSRPMQNFEFFGRLDYL